MVYSAIIVSHLDTTKSRPEGQFHRMNQNRHRHTQTRHHLHTGNLQQSTTRHMPRRGTPFNLNLGNSHRTVTSHPELVVALLILRVSHLTSTDSRSSLKNTFSIDHTFNVFDPLSLLLIYFMTCVDNFTLYPVFVSILHLERVVSAFRNITLFIKENVRRS